MRSIQEELFLGADNQNIDTELQRLDDFQKIRMDTDRTNVADAFYRLLQNLQNDHQRQWDDIPGRNVDLLTSTSTRMED